MDLLAKDRAAQSRTALQITIAMGFVAATGLVYWIFPKNTSCAGQSGPLSLGYDWICVFRPSIINLFHGHNPYAGLYFNPPWALLLLSPLALLPPGLGATVIAVLCLAAFGFAAARLGMNRLSMIFLLMNPFIWVVARQGNLDWLVALGAALPPQIGLFLVVTKPQSGIAIVVFWLVESMRQGGIRQAVRVFAPVTAAYLLSFIIFGWWIFPPGWLITHQMNYSLWPLSIPIGLALLAVALRDRDIRRAITASPFLSPYVLTMSWSLAFLGLKDWELIAAFIGAEIMFFFAPGFGTYPIHLMP